MYFWYGNLGGFNEGSCAIGANKACSTWYLAEGCTRAGFEQWICLQNPNDEVATVRLTYMLENTSCPEQVVSVAPHTRLTVRVNDFVGPDHDVSTEVPVPICPSSSSARYIPSTEAMWPALIRSMHIPSRGRLPAWPADAMNKV